jgi:putative Mg2+ transporter-C (MgtC) family protein
LGLAFGLSSLIGLEREWRQKSAGLRTHTLVGTGAALLVVVSKYGFSDVLGPHVILDPSRVAAGIVSGIGFIGGGLIFVRGDAVRGLTTAAIVWRSRSRQWISAPAPTEF